MNTGPPSISAVAAAFPPGETLDGLPTSTRSSPGRDRFAAVSVRTRGMAVRVSYSSTIRVTTQVETSRKLMSAHPHQLVEDWQSYLSRECVAAMVERNWHHTTR
jgi:hypothetical protein